MSTGEDDGAAAILMDAAMRGGVPAPAPLGDIVFHDIFGDAEGQRQARDRHARQVAGAHGRLF
ncbi:hypothetical protein GHK39_09160 [Sinorhizobium medicae]|uniref:hypothetical protein n=1 Tax=Sinorhizobium medicae TaxID=110321 RepID=UPI001295C0D1|nr:hypothetical protein [Sinorhizobium medicae]MQV84842.1 hypothetical protein [Sinorhizobium medicae]MQV95530.1 hypothetical protein [Sinorhizobium medicae]